QSAGISLGLTGAVVAAAEAAYSATKRGTEVEDDRLKALYAAKTAYSVNDSIDAYQAASAQGQSMGGISLRIGIGASSSSSKTTTHEETTGGSRILSEGNVTIAATGGDLNVIGSKITGENVALAAANNLNLLSNEETNTSKSENKNAGGEIGVSVGTTTGVYVTAYAGKGSAKGNSDL
ncbi:hemagglutinin repeat-containing protein, partial [Xanthomonas graminis]